MSIKKRLISGLTSVAMILGVTAIPIGETIIHSGMIIDVSAEPIENFTYDDEDIFVADALLSQATLSDGTRYFNASPSLAYEASLREWVYKQIAEDIIEEPWLIAADTFWLNMEKSIKLDYFGENNIFTWQQIMYEELLMDYLTYSYSSSEFKSSIQKNTAKYAYSLEKKALASEILDDDAFNEKIKTMTKEEAREFFEKQKALESYKDVDVEVYDTLMDSVDTAKEYFDYVAKMQALKEADYNRIGFLNRVKASTTDENLISAIDHVKSCYITTTRSLAINKLIDISYEKITNMVWEKVKDEMGDAIKVPGFSSLKLGVAGIDWLFNNKGIAESRMQLTIIYIIGVDVRLAYQESRDTYISNHTEENARDFINAYQQYLYYVAYASNIANKYLGERLIDGYANEIASLIDPNNSNQISYNDFNKAINGNINSCQILSEYIDGFRYMYNHSKGYPIKYSNSTSNKTVLSRDKNTYGDLIISNDLDLNGHTLTVYGDCKVDGGILNLNGGKMTVTGKMTIGTQSFNSGAFSAKDGELTVNGDLVIDSFTRYHTLIFDVAGGTVNVNGNLIQIEGNLDVNNGTINVSNDYIMKNDDSYCYGNLIMNDKNDIINVGRNFEAKLYGHSNDLTDGKLTVGNNLYIYQYEDRYYSGYISSGNHVLVFDGDKLHTITMNGSCDLLGRIELTNNARVKFVRVAGFNLSEDMVLNEDTVADKGTWNLNGHTLTINGNFTCSSVLDINNGKLIINGIYTSSNNVNVNNGEIEVIGDCKVDGGTLNLNGGKMTVTGKMTIGTQSFNSGALSAKDGELTVNGDLVIDSFTRYHTLIFDVAGGTVNVNGNLIQIEGNLDVNNGVLNITNDYIMKNNDSFCYGNLIMNDENDIVYVGGNFEARLYSYSNNLTDGRLTVGNDLYIYQYEDRYYSGYISSGNHVLVFDGDKLHNITMNGSRDLLGKIELTNNARVKFKKVAGFSLSEDMVLNEDTVADKGTWNLNGHTLTINGDFTCSSTLDINNGKLIGNRITLRTYPIEV